MGSGVKPLDQLQTPKSTQFKEQNQSEYYTIAEGNNVRPVFKEDNLKKMYQETSNFRKERQYSANSQK